MRGIFDLDNLQNSLKDINTQLALPNAWKQDNFLILQKDYKNISYKLDTFKNLLDQAQYLQEICEILTSAEINNDLLLNVKELKSKVNAFKQATIFTQDDSSNCYVEIFCGMGGSDAQDFTLMILNMYIKYCTKNNLVHKLVDITTTEFGIKNAVLYVEAENAYGFLKNESGVHRLVRISPFNSDDKRHTSFCSVNVYRDLIDDQTLQVLEKDIKFETFRAQGAGGQHVNTTDSAVRATYLPLNIIAIAQGDRSQHKNKAVAIKLLKSKVYNFYRNKKEQVKKQSYNTKQDIDFGNHIRSYILHPYLMVKDTRISYSAANVNAVLNGELNELIMLLLTK